MSFQITKITPGEELARCDQKYDFMHWVNLHKSTKPNPALPIQAGVWVLDDTSSGTESFVAHADEFKYIVRGSITLKDVKTGIERTAEAGCILWIEEGSEAIITRSKDLVAVYVEVRENETVDGVSEAKSEST